MNLNEMAAEIHQVSVDKGFWPKEMERDFGMVIALIHSELSEALEEYRAGSLPDETYYSNRKLGEPKKPEGIPSELADVIIRTLDACAAWGIDIDEIVAEKMEYNKSRNYRHGGKLV